MEELNRIRVSANRSSLEPCTVGKSVRWYKLAPPRNGFRRGRVVPPTFVCPSFFKFSFRRRPLSGSFSLLTLVVVHPHAAGQVYQLSACQYEKLPPIVSISPDDVLSRIGSIRQARAPASDRGLCGDNFLVGMPRIYRSQRSPPSLSCLSHHGTSVTAQKVARVLRSTLLIFKRLLAKIGLPDRGCKPLPRRHDLALCLRNTTA
jgi:hypothetical protein